MPIFDVAGQIRGVLQQAEDVTSEVTAEAMRDVVSREFDHRVKNLLATVASIARRTAQSATSIKAFLQDFDARIAAIARTHHLLVQGGWDGLGLAELLEAALGAFTGADGDFIASGPAVELSGRQAQALGLAFHELATNAAKFGSYG